LCEEAVVDLDRRGRRPFGLDLVDIGAWWDRGSHEIDLIGLSRDEAVLVECNVSHGRLTDDRLASFHAACEAFAVQHPRIRQRRAVVTWSPPTSRERARCGDAGVEVIPFDDLLDA
jgi:hypothetical protein